MPRAQVLKTAAEEVAGRALSELTELTSAVAGSVAKSVGETMASVGSYFGSALENSGGLVADLVFNHTPIYALKVLKSPITYMVCG